MIKRVLVYLAIAGFTLPLFAQKSGITAKDLKDYVYFLASDSLKGRKPGTAEMNVAAKYILEHFKTAGLKPLAENGFQYFDIVIDVTLGSENKLSLDSYDAAFRKDFIPLAFSSSGEVKANVVFAGYGFDLDLDSLKWSDYSGIDVKGKWVMIFRADPELDKTDSKFIPFSDARSKVLTAKDKGAAGVLLVTPRGLDKDDKLMAVVVENNEVTSGIPVVNIRHEVADRILAAKGMSADSLEHLITARQKPNSFETGMLFSGKVDVVQKHAKTANVIALLEGSDNVLRDEYLVVGGHYDHLGFGGPGSGSRVPDTNAIHNGADDNASGTAMVMELAKALGPQKSKLKRSILFIAFSGEEMGLLGSKYFVNNPPVDLKKIKAMFNFDMVGRFDKEKNSISISGTGTSAEGDSILKVFEKGLPFMVTHSPDGYGPSDHASFYSSNIPVFFFTTGVHMDYHTPADDADKLDYKAEKKIGDFSAALIADVDNLNKDLTFKESGKKENTGRSGRRLKVTLGIMPDFAGSEKKGLRVDGVTKDGPAYKGGMLKGDIIISVHGMKVENIYDYMARLNKLKAGMTVNVEVLRNGKVEILIIQL
ncbi:MAG: M20/M25/M40 family metallo-hydrolase [Bacteroidetes bacterium]|nr:M20/M25/M40 family metallo-hydrolase [Bacteroidota bacterium]